MSISERKTIIKRIYGWIASIGPAIIVASVVMGPGSILVSSKMGAEYGYEMLWVLVVSVFLMISMVMLCARLSIGHEGSMCQELAKSVGKPTTIFVGLILFLIIACFQTSNNMAIIAAIEPFLQSADSVAKQISPLKEGYTPIVVLLVFNALVIGLLFGFRNLYKKLELMMKATVFIMMVAFLANMIVASPSIVAVLKGLIPSMPEVLTFNKPNQISDKSAHHPIWILTGMIATTFSVAGAFYQGYLVKERGWTKANLKDGTRDSIAGIVTLGILSAMIMITGAAVLHGRIDASELKSISDISGQIRPLFGDHATLLFSIGIFAGAFNPFIVNAIIGGTVFSDSLGYGSKLENIGPKVLTTLALGIGMFAAILSIKYGADTIGVIVFAQALTVLGIPVLTIAIFWLATRRGVSKEIVPTWLKVMCGVSIVVSIVLAIRMVTKLAS